MRDNWNKIYNINFAKPKSGAPDCNKLTIKEYEDLFFLDQKLKKLFGVSFLDKPCADNVYLTQQQPQANEQN